MPVIVPYFGGIVRLPHDISCVLVLMGLLGGTGCQAPASPTEPTPVQVVEPTPKVLYVHILQAGDGTLVVTNTVPPPEAILAVRVPSPTLVANTTLTCVKDEGVLVCDGGILEFVGCYAPEPIEQSPVVRAALRPQEF